MKRLISLTIPLPSGRNATDRASRADKVGNTWQVMAGAFAWTEKQMAHKLDALPLATSEWACTASTPDISRTRKMQPRAAQRNILFPNWLLLITRTFATKPRNIAPGKRAEQGGYLKWNVTPGRVTRKKPDLVPASASTHDAILWYDYSSRAVGSYRVTFISALG